MSVLPLKLKKCTWLYLRFMFMFICHWSSTPSNYQRSIYLFVCLGICDSQVSSVSILWRFLKLRLSLFQVRRIEVQHSATAFSWPGSENHQTETKPVGTCWNRLEQNLIIDPRTNRSQEPPPMPHGLWRGGPLIWWTQKGDLPMFTYWKCGYVWLC